MKNILVTRDKNNSKQILRDLDNKGHNLFFEPLFTVEKLPINLDLDEFYPPISAIIITSANACFALENSKIEKKTKIFTVGTNTAAKIKSAGFENIVISPQNSAESLFELVKKESGSILYLRGETISFDFVAKQKNIREIICYKTHEISNFSVDFKKINYDEVQIFSKNSCEIFNKIIRQHNLLEYFANSQILCLSQQILKKAEELGFKKVSIIK